MRIHDDLCLPIFFLQLIPRRFVTNCSRLKVCYSVSDLRSMEDLIDALQKELRRNHIENGKCKKHLFTENGNKQTPYCLFCHKQDHWSVNCTIVTALADRKKFFVDCNLCFNCGRSNHRADQRRRRGCMKCKYRHHTSICDRQERENNSSLNGVSLTGWTNYAEEKVLPAIIPVSIEGQVLWAYLDTGSQDTISSHTKQSSC